MGKTAGGLEQFASLSVKITGDCRDGAGEWTVSSGVLPRLLNCRARLVWRYAGEGPWRDELLSLPGVAGKSFRFGLRAATADVALEGSEQSNAGWEFSGRMTNTGNRPIELLRFHYLDGAVESTDPVALLLLQSQAGGAENCYRRGWEVPPIRNPRRAEECWDIPPQDTRLPDPIYDEPDWICGVDVGVFFTNSGAPGWVLGATGPGKAFGETGFRSAGSDAGHFFAGQLLDNILLAPGETRELERLLILAGDWQAGLRAWAAACAQALGAPDRKYPLAGFCSWYRNFAEFTMADVDRAIEEFGRLPVPPGGRMIQIDDGFQRAPGDWGPNTRYTPAWWAHLPARITASGSIPVLWLAPLSVLETNPIVKDHPDWFQRLPDGRFAFVAMNWGWCDNPSWKFGERGGRLTHNLDADHPGAREFIRALLKEAVTAGWRAFKLDFNASCYNTRIAYDRRKTTFETLRDQYRLFREAVGPDILLNACIGGAGRYALGYADSARIAGDMVGDWTTMHTLLPVVLIRMPATNGIWWSADPDVFSLREKSAVITGSYFDAVALSASKEEQSLLLTVMGMMGGMLYTSDLPSEWSDETRRKVREFWGEDKPCPAANPRLVLDPRNDIPLACTVERMIDGGRRIQCALFNWSDETASITVTVAELGLEDPESWHLERADDSVALRDGVLISTQPPHSARTALLGQRNCA